MKKLFLVAICLGLFGCGAYHRGCAKWTGSSEMCVDGITYIQFTSGATPKVDSEGNVVKCK